MTILRFLIVSIFFGVCFSLPEGNEIVQDDRRHSCFTDRDCAETDFCSRNNICVSCFSCELINQQRGGKRCSKSQRDCGDCLPGYAQASYNGSNKKKVCSPVVTKAEPMTSEDRSQFTTNPTTVIGVIILGTLAIIAFVSWHCYRKRSTPDHDSWSEMELGPRARCADGASLPPPSYEDAQRSENGSSVAYSFQLRVTERAEKQTTAIPFQLPLGENIVTLAQPSHENSTAANESSVTAEESVTDFPTPIDLHDESTQPSSWTPGAAYLMAQDETDGGNNEQKVSPPNKRRKTDEKETPKNSEDEPKNDPDC